MTTTFLNRHLEELYATGKSRKYRLPAQVVRKFALRVDTLKAADSIHDLQRIGGLRFEALSGTDLFSVRIDRQYRLEFKIDFADEDRTVGVVGIKELSNHYGD